MSSYIQFLISFLSKHTDKLTDDKGSIELILTKIIDIDHISLFYRFMEAIMNHTSLEEFYKRGYMNIAVQGGQVISNKTIQGRKASLIFICKLLCYYDTANTLQLVKYCLIQINDCYPQYFDQLLQANEDIIKTLSARSDRKYLFAAICKSVSLGYFYLYLDISRILINWVV